MSTRPHDGIDNLGKFDNVVPLRPNSPNSAGIPLPTQREPAQVSPSRIGILSPTARITMPEIVTRLDIPGGRQTQIGHVRQLNEYYGFPDTVTLRSWGGRILRGSRAIVWKSKFDRAAVEAWLDRHFNSPAAQPAVPPELRDQLDAIGAKIAALG